MVCRWCHSTFRVVGDLVIGGKDEPGKYHITKLGFINDIDQFDPLEFGISAKEAANFDPAIRLALEASQTVRPLCPTFRHSH